MIHLIASFKIRTSFFKMRLSKGSNEMYSNEIYSIEIGSNEIYLNEIYSNEIGFALLTVCIKCLLDNFGWRYNSV